MQVWIRRQKCLRYPQTLFVESPYGDGDTQAAGEARGICGSAHNELAKGPGHPFYQRVNELLEEERFDEFAERGARSFTPQTMGDPR